MLKQFRQRRIYFLPQRSHNLQERPSPKFFIFYFMKYEKKDSVMPASCYLWWLPYCPQCRDSHRMVVNVVVNLLSGYASSAFCTETAAKLKVTICLFFTEHQPGTAEDYSSAVICILRTNRHSASSPWNCRTEVQVHTDAFLLLVPYQTSHFPSRHRCYHSYLYLVPHRMVT
jgi:hypothetical protein